MLALEIFKRHNKQYYANNIGSVGAGSKYLTCVYQCTKLQHRVRKKKEEGAMALPGASSPQFEPALKEIAQKKSPDNGNVFVNPKSANYLSTKSSQFFRYEMAGEGFFASVLVKAAQTDPEVRTAESVRDKFLNEINFYSQVVPKIRPIIEQWNENQPPFRLIVPDYFGHDSTDGLEWLAIEDVSAQYLKQEKLEDLDKEHVKAAVVALAAFHSASLEWKSSSPEDFFEVATKFVEVEMLPKSSEEDVKTERINNVLTTALQISELRLSQPYSNALENLLDSAINGCSDWVGAEKAEPWSVIAHGDCWSDNFLFNHDDNKNIIGVAMVDFQCARASSPLADVVNFLLSSGGLNVIRDIRPFIEKHNQSIRPKMTEYRRHVRLCGPYGFVGALVHHFYCIETETPANDEELEGEREEENDKKLYVNPQSEKRAAVVIRAAHDARLI